MFQTHSSLVEILVRAGTAGAGGITTPTALEVILSVGKLLRTRISAKNSSGLHPNNLTYCPPAFRRRVTNTALEWNRLAVQEELPYEAIVRQDCTVHLHAPPQPSISLNRGRIAPCTFIRSTPAAELNPNHWIGLNTYT